MKKLVLFLFALAISNNVVAQLKCGELEKLPDLSGRIINSPYSDAFGNKYEDIDLEIPLENSNGSPHSVTDCGCKSVGINTGYFNLVFEDCVFDIKTGFNDPLKGFNRKKATCTAFKNLSEKITQFKNPENCGIENKVNVQIISSHTEQGGNLYYGKVLAPLANDVGGSASPVFSSSTGRIDPLPWLVINSGVSNTLKGKYHAKIRFNFASEDHSYYDGIEPISSNSDEYDLYTVTLHEAVHALGIISALDADANSFVSKNQLGGYTRWDTKLKLLTTSGNKDIIIYKSFLSLYTWEYSGIATSKLYHTCDNDPKTSENLVFNASGNSYPIFTDLSYNAGSSFSHLQIDCDGKKTEEFLMHPFLKPGIRRNVTKSEWDILCNLGYKIEGQSDCDLQIAGSNDGIDCSTKLVVDPCKKELIIDTKDLLKNDANATGLIGLELTNPNYGQITNIPNTTTFKFTSSGLPGSAVLRYIPTRKNKAGVEIQGNITYVFLSIPYDENCSVICEPLSTCNQIPTGYTQCAVSAEYDDNLNKPCNVICNPKCCYLMYGKYDDDNFKGIATGVLNKEVLETVKNDVIIKKPGWLDYYGTPDLVTNISILTTFFDASSPSTSAYIMKAPEGIYQYLKLPQKKLLFAVDRAYAKNVSGNYVIDLVEEGVPSHLNPDPNSFVQPIYSPNNLTPITLLSEIKTPISTSERFTPFNRFGTCLTINEAFDKYNIIRCYFKYPNYSKGIAGVDNFELIADDFTAGTDGKIKKCGEVFSLGNKWCMLKGVGVEYKWYENNATVPFATYRIKDGIVSQISGATVDTKTYKFDAFPKNATTIYKVERIVYDYGQLLPSEFKLCDNTDEVVVLVEEGLQDASFTYMSNKCEYTFKSKSTFSGKWDFGDGTSSSSLNPIHTYLKPGKYTVTHSVTSPCGTSTYTETINVTCISADFSYITQVNKCANSMQFTPDELQGSHTWDFGDGTTSNEVSPLHSYQLAGTYTVVHSVVINGSTQTSSQTITIKIGNKGKILQQNISNAIKSNVVQSSSSSSNETYIVSGVFTIDLNYSFDNCTFLMSPASKIEIAESIKLSLSSCQFYACDDYMWQGIEARAPTKGIKGGEIVMKSCKRVEDAHNAVRLNDRTLATITGNVFTKNYVDVSVADANAQKIALTQFTAHSNKHNAFNIFLKKPYKGQSINSSFPRAAYQFSNCISTCTVGENKPGQITEWIDGYLDGITAVNTELNTINVYFKNIQPRAINNGGVDYGFAIRSENVGAVGKLAVGGIDKNTTLFEDCQTGVFSTNVRTDVTNTKMVGMGAGISIAYTYPINQGVSNIKNNYIAGQSGVSAIYSAGCFVEGNDFYCKSTNSSPSSAIVLNYCNGSYIHQNTAKIDDISCGIRLTNCNGGRIVGNKNIEILNSRGLSPSKAQLFTDGINIINSTQLSIQDNTVLGKKGGNRDPLKTAETVGIFMQNSSNNDFCCNSVDYTNEGVEARNVNDISNRLQTTTFNEHALGLYVRFSGSLIGSQSHTGNIWNNLKIPAARNDNSVNNKTYYLQNQFKVVDPQGSNIFPNLLTPPTDWFKGFTLGKTITCNQGSCVLKATIPTITDIDVQLLKEDVTKIYGEVNTWKLTRNLYEKLDANPSLKLDDDALFNFYEQYQSGNIAAFTGIKAGIDYLTSFGKEQLAANESNISNIKAQIQKVDAQLLISEDAQSLIIEKNALLDILNKAASASIAQNESIKKEKKAEFAVLTERNENIPTEYIYEENLKVVNTVSIALQASESNTLSDEQRNELEKVAYQCDTQGGEAVQSARALLTWYDEKYNFDRENTCEEIFYTKVQKNNRSSKIVLQPNPASNILSITNNLEANKVVITTLLGQIVSSSILENTTVNLDISNIGIGMYLCHFFANDKIITTEKITIIR